MLNREQQNRCRRHVMEAARQLQNRVIALDELLQDRTELDDVARREDERMRLVSLRYEVHEALALL